MNVFRNMLYMARRFKTATVLNFIGLTVSFAAFYLLMTQVTYNRSYNFSIPDGERVFRLESKMNPDAQWGINSSRPINTLLAKLPQVEAVSELAAWEGGMDIQVGETTVKQFCAASNLTPFGAVGTRCLDGRLSWNDYGERTAIIPASLARKVYGRVNVAGETLYANSDTMTIQGVYEDFPDNCSIKNNLYYANQENLDNWSEWSSNLYVKLTANVDADALLKEFPKQLQQLMWREQWGQAVASGEYDENQEADIKAKFDAHFGYEFRLTPIRDTYFSGVSSDDKGNPAMLFILELASLLIIVIAAINFLNFTLAESPMRIKGLNTRRVLGESLWHLRFGLVGCPVCCCIAATHRTATGRPQPFRPPLAHGPYHPDSDCGRHRCRYLSCLLRHLVPACSHTQRLFRSYAKRKAAAHGTRLPANLHCTLNGQLHWHPSPAEPLHLPLRLRLRERRSTLCTAHRRVET